MSVKKDAGELLIYFYLELKNKEAIYPEDVINQTRWSASKINSAMHCNALFGAS